MHKIIPWSLVLLFVTLNSSLVIMPGERESSATDDARGRSSGPPAPEAEESFQITQAMKGAVSGQSERSTCLSSTITMNTATLEKIVEDPAAILADPDAFWKQERPLVLTQKWIDRVGYDFDREKWVEEIEAWAQVPAEERGKRFLATSAQAIVRSKDEFTARVLPHLCSYLPPDADLNVTVQFTAFVPPNAFALEDIVINVSHRYWQENVENIYNLLAHELFHAGYSYCRDHQSETPLEDEELYRMLDNFISEGISTYVGYQAQPLFPAPHEKDYQMLDDPVEVKRLRGDVNSVFSQVGVLPEDKMQKLAWEKCVIGRGYYVVGAHMSRVIDRELGREALVAHLLEGPVSFVKSYNSLVEKDQRIQVAIPGMAEK